MPSRCEVYIIDGHECAWVLERGGYNDNPVPTPYS